MAFALTCDNAACGAEIDSGEGQPALSQRQRIYCAACNVYIASVEAQLKREMTEFAHEGIARLEARRKELMAQMLPTNRGGSGEGVHLWPPVQANG
jgi:hypothetical protein